MLISNLTFVDEMKQIDHTQTVSYTHLDVYKRQPVAFLLG